MENVTHLVKYEITPEDIRAMGEQFAKLTCDTSKDYEQTRKAIGVLRSTRVQDGAL